MGPHRLAPAELRVLVCDDLDAAALAAFRERGIEPEVRTGLSEARLLELVPGAHALVVRSATRVTRAVIEAAGELRVVGRAGVGVDNVDCAAATERGVVVMNTPTGNTTTTAELAIALLCSLARHIPQADRRARAGNWGKKGLMGTELTGKTLGVVGLGRIGRVVAERGLGLRMRVLAHDPYLSGHGVGSPVEGCELVELDELLAASDFVTLHVPLLEGTRNLFSRERLAKMKRGARLVNAARGGLVDEGALAEALASGHLAGAALDVLTEEPPSPDHPLLGREDVILTPHLGASSHEAQHAVAVEIARQVADFLLEGVMANTVNAPSVSGKTLQRIAPYVLLAERMGSFLAQRMEQPIRKLEVTLSGEIAREGRSYLPLSLLVGLLRQSDPGANYVNAPLLAKERDLRLLESADEEAHYFQGLIKVRATSKGGEESHLVAGTVFGRAPRLVRIDDLHLDLEPAGALLITQHRDRPGVLGQLGTLLGAAGVNIRSVQLGAFERSGASPELASGFFSLDDDPSPEVLSAIAALEPIEEVRLVRL